MSNAGELMGSEPPQSYLNEDFARSVNALFDTRDHAETARQDLIAAGIHAGDIALIADAEAPAAESAEPGVVQSGGFWETLKELFMPEEDRNQFAEGVRRGGVTVSVRTDTANHDRVIDILDRDGAVDLDERQESWRNDGWTGYTAKDPLSDARTPALALSPDDADMSYAAPSAGTAGFGASEADRFPIGEETAPPIESPGALPASALSGDVDWSPAAGGRESNGRARVRSYTNGATGMPKGIDPQI